MIWMIGYMCNLSPNAMLKTVILFALPWIAYAYENVALHKNAWQLHPYESTYYKDSLNASNAVDGLKTNLSFIGGQCTHSGNGQYEAMWRVDLGAVLGINHITLYYKTENVLWGPDNGYARRFLGFSVYVSNTTDRKDGILCFKDDYFTKYTIPAVLTLNCTHYGRYVIYYNNRTSRYLPPDYSQYAYNELCEFEVYGCPVPDHYGKNCNQTCSSRCKDNRCHIETGYCLHCENGYRGPYCKEQCKNNTYGAGCLEKCGQCLGGEKCHFLNGICSNGCEAGYYNFSCKSECPDSQYGRNCLQTCSKNCHVSYTCDKMTGACHGGCIEGWKLPQCNKECDDRTFGTNCSKVCGHCYQGKACNKKTGVCPPVCDSGYDGLYCNQFQPPGTQQAVVNQPTIATMEQPMQAATSPISKTFPEEHSFGGKHNVYDSQSELFVAEIEKLKLEMEYIKLLTKKVSSEIEILELKKKSLSANCTALSSSEKQ
ncbi:uncharacterized protein [Magallana gigas]|uniref:uncharacterized protein isoform X4 n=1 Tax=Magallana gigas TaxID=29159 RepID=UPI0033416E97